MQVSQLIVILVQWIASEVLSRCFLRLSSPLLTNLCILLCIFVLGHLVALQRRSTSLRGLPNRDEQYTVAAVAVVLAFAFALVILLAPAWLLDVRVDEGIAGLRASTSQWSELWAQVRSC